MTTAKIFPAASLNGTIAVPGDKSISHRALLFAALAQGRSIVNHLGQGADVRSTAACLQTLGVPVKLTGDTATVDGVGLDGLRAPKANLDCGNSGTSMRLLSGIVAGARLDAILTGDHGLCKRPMRRITQPLQEMGAQVSDDERPPLRFVGGAKLNGVAHSIPVASAQVKSCLLLAGLYALEETSVREPGHSRDHTERMLASMGAPLTVHSDGRVSITAPLSPLAPLGTLTVPGDPSSAAFLAAAAALVPGGDIHLPNVDDNPSRSGFFSVLERMGAKVSRTPCAGQAGDPVSSFRVEASALLATTVTAAEIPSLVDEVPILALLATAAKGTTRIEGAGELRVKECDRLAVTANGLRAMGADVEELTDGLVIHGPTVLKGTAIDTHSDHRIAMTFAVAGLIAQGPTVINDAQWADVSWPGFFSILNDLCPGSVTLAD